MPEPTHYVQAHEVDGKTWYIILTPWRGLMYLFKFAYNAKENAAKVRRTLDETIPTCGSITNNYYEYKSGTPLLFAPVSDRWQRMKGSYHVSLNEHTKQKA